MTTQSYSCARLGLAQLMSTMVLVGAAGLFVPSPCDASWVAAGVHVSAVADQTPGSSDWTADTTLQDPPDSPDDEDGPDAQQDTSSAIVGHGCVMTCLDASPHVVRIAPVSMSARSVEGHFMRGPPAAEEDTTNLDEDDEEDDDDFLSADGVQPATASGDSTQRNRFLTNPEAHFLRLLPSGTHSLRAPPR
jgi:hypothetical protein